MNSNFINKIQQYYSTPTKDLYTELTDYQQHSEAWQCVQYMQDTNPYLKSFATSTIKFKCKYSLTSLPDENQQQLLSQLLQLKCFDTAALIVVQHIDWLEHCTDLPELLSECALLDNFPPITLSKYLELLAQHPLGLDTIGRLLHKSSISLDKLLVFVQQAISTHNFVFLTEVSAIYFNSAPLLTQISEFALSLNYKDLDNEELLNYVYMCVELGESNIPLLIKQCNQYQAYLQLMIQLSTLPVLHTLMFWTYLTDKLHSSNISWTPIYLELFKHIFVLLQYPNDNVDVFLEHRRDLSDILSLIFRVLQDDFFQFLSNAPTHWQSIEAQFFCVRCIGYDLQLTKQYLHLQHILSHPITTDSNPLILQCRCQCTQSLSLYYHTLEWFQMAFEWIDTCPLTTSKSIASVLRSTSFLFQDMHKYQISLQWPDEFIIKLFNAAWQPINKEAMQHFCRCIDYILDRPQLQQMVQAWCDHLITNPTPIHMLMLSLVLQHVHSPMCLQLIERALQLTIPPHPFVAKFYKNATPHLTSINQVINIVQHVMNTPVHGQYHALEVLLMKGYSINGDGWESLVLQVMHHVLNGQVQEAEIENKCDLLIQLSDTPVMQHVDMAILFRFISMQLPNYLTITQVPEQIDSIIHLMMRYMQCCNAIGREMTADLPPLHAHLEKSIMDGLLQVIPYLISISKREYFFITNKDIGILIVLCYHYNPEEFKKNYYMDIQKESRAGYKAQQEHFMTEMLQQMGNLSNGQEFKRQVMQVMSIIRKQKQWYEQVQ